MPFTGPPPARAVRILFVGHGLISGAAGIVLMVAPDAIPGVAGVDLAPGQELLCYLLAGAELAVATFSILAARDVAVWRAAAVSIAVMHGVTLGLEFLAVTGTGSSVVLLNAVVRLPVVVVFTVVALSTPRPDGRAGVVQPDPSSRR